MPDNIVMADTDEIECYSELSEEFLQDILDLDLDECFISDESQLADFSGCGTPDDSDVDDWDTYILDKIDNHYGVRVNVGDYLITIFDQIVKAKAATRQ